MKLLSLRSRPLAVLPRRRPRCRRRLGGEGPQHLQLERLHRRRARSPTSRRKRASRSATTTSTTTRSCGQAGGRKDRLRHRVALVQLGPAADRRRAAGQDRQVQAAQLQEPRSSIQAQLGKMDPGNQCMVNWLWGFTTVGINVDKVKAALGSTRCPTTSGTWCSSRNTSASSRAAASFSTRPARWCRRCCTTWANRRSASADRLRRRRAQAIRPYITLFSSSGYINDMANGSICLSLGWSGDINIARQRASTARPARTSGIAAQEPAAAVLRQ